MMFLAPLFLLGSLAIAGPVLFHLVRRATKEKTPFSSLLFLRPDPPRLTQRSRIEHWLLLLLRALALGLLALAFARPFLRTAAPAEDDPAGSRRIVLLVDSSASMNRTGLRTAAREKADAILRSARPVDQVAVWSFDSATHRLMDFTQWSALPADTRASVAGGLLDEIKPGWAATNLSSALTGAAELLAEGAHKGGGSIILISDLQEGSRVEGLQGWEWPQGVQVTAVSVTPANKGNAGLHLAPDLSGMAAAADPVARVRVSNSADSTSEQFQTGWATADGTGFSGQAVDVYVPPGQSRIASLPWPKGANTPGRLLLRGDGEIFDNTVFAAPPVTAEVRACYFGPEAATDAKESLFFLTQALPQTQQVRVDLTLVKPADALPVILPGQPVIFFASGAVPDAQADFLHTQLVAGRTALLALTKPDAAPALARISGVAAPALEDVKPANYGMLSQLDFQHPLLAPFADPRFSDFTKIRFWKYRRFTAASLPGSRVIAKFDSGDPALVEVPVGAGRLLVLASGWQPEDSQLALSSKFVPLLSSLLEWSGAVVTPPAQFLAGQPVPLSQLGFVNAGAVTLKSPDGTTTVVEPASGVFNGATQPGLYTATAGVLTRSFAVNLDPAESRTAPLPPDDLERLGVPVKPGTGKLDNPAAVPENAPAIEAESRQKLWRWIIAGALAVLLIETLLAGLTARRATATGGTVP